MSLTRRSIIIATAVGGISTLAGCFPENTPYRRLTARGINVDSREENPTLIVTVVNDNTIGDSEADFTNVSLLGYTNDGRLVCDQYIGRVSHEWTINNGTEVELECAEMPSVVTFDAAESPCDDNTGIDGARYDEEQEAWILDQPRECGEGLPPAIEGDRSN